MLSRARLVRALDAADNVVNSQQQGGTLDGCLDGLCFHDVRLPYSKLLHVHDVPWKSTNSIQPCSHLYSHSAGAESLARTPACNLVSTGECMECEHRLAKAAQKSGR